MKTKEDKGTETIIGALIFGIGTATALTIIAALLIAFINLIH